jgi:hypothetical protein
VCQSGSGWAKATVPNLDFVVAKKGFFFDLGIWDDEVRQPLATINHQTYP